ncbi:MAG: TetR/AcrR family transcriptional regulator [Deltaproteobacteria bacterium]|nr:MAG: TetR/AcrR family transcriptional regulator [Deltaproteobacteria bacterium]
MARPRTISDEQILEAARVVFTRDGVAASTATVAREAGVSEGTIFRRFPTKEALFQRAMASGDEWELDTDARIGRGDIQEQLAALVLDMIEAMRRTLPRMMALASCGSHPREVWRADPDAAPHRTLKVIIGYFDAEMRLGRLAPTDPEVLARMVLGSVHNFVFFEHMGIDAGGPIAAPTYARSLVRILWRGLDPQPQGRALGEGQ